MASNARGPLNLFSDTHREEALSKWGWEADLDGLGSNSSYGGWVGPWSHYIHFPVRHGWLWVTTRTSALAVGGHLKVEGGQASTGRRRGKEGRMGVKGQARAKLGLLE